MRIIVSEGVVVQAGFAVEVLALKAEVLRGEEGVVVLLVQGGPPDLLSEAPDDLGRCGRSGPRGLR